VELCYAGQDGVNTTDMFIEGAIRYGKSKGVSLCHSVMEVSPRPSLRPSKEEMRAFMETAMQKDLPVAFLNLSNGALSNLDNWHWVTITAFDIKQFTAVMCDQGKQYEIEMDRWLHTTLMGGGLVTIEPSAV
jgi:hypothetical protein